MRIESHNLPAFVWVIDSSAVRDNLPPRKLGSLKWIHGKSEVHRVEGIDMATGKPFTAYLAHCCSTEAQALKALRAAQAHNLQHTISRMTDRQRQLRKSRKGAKPVPGQTER
jgi:hypothetical protein